MSKPPKPSNEPHRRVVHCDPKAPKTSEQEPLPHSVAKKPVGAKSQAEWAYERLILYIQNFEQQLDSQHEVALGVTDGGAGPLRIEGIGYFDPDIVTFYGTGPAGTRSQLIQHVSQLNVTLSALPKAAPEAEPRRIGFRLAQDLDAT